MINFIKIVSGKKTKSFSEKIKFFQCVEYFQLAKSFGIMAKVGLSNDPALADCFQNFQEMWCVLINEAQRDTEVDSWKTSILDFSDGEFH